MNKNTFQTNILIISFNKNIFINKNNKTYIYTIKK